MNTDILIYNANCITMEDENCDWLAIKGNEISDFGKGNTYLPLLSNCNISIDAKGKTVLPGFIDSHFHLVQTAMNKSSIDLTSATCFKDIGDAIRIAEKLAKDEPLICVRLNKDKLAEKRYPNRLELDRLSSNVPIWINSMDYQVSILNTYGLLYYKIPFNVDGIDIDENGVATGIFYGKANAILRRQILDSYPNSKRYNSVSALIPNLLKSGITSINAMEGGYMYSDKDADFVYEHSSEFPIDMALFYQSMNFSKVREKKLDRIGGCLYVDGTIGARTAALSFEYADCPKCMGRLILSQQELNDFVAECYVNKLQLSLYTIGDRAIQTALNAHEYALYQTGNKGLRHRLEHVILASDAHIKRAKELEIIFSMNPIYESVFGGAGNMYNDHLGENYKNTNRFREILDAGITLCAGSDSDVCSYNPFLGIHAAVNHPVSSHRISLQEALKMYTLNAAFAISEENIKGSLKPGKLADIIILNDDITKIPSDRLDEVNVLCTIKSGEILFNGM